MEEITSFIRAGVTWALTLFMVGLLLRSARKNWNPLDWCTVDRCLLIMAIYFFFGGFLQLFPVIKSMSGLEKELIGRFSYVNWVFIDSFAQSNSIVLLGWVVLLLIALWLRRRSPDSNFFAHIVVQVTAAQTALYGYFFGTVTNPMAILFGMALGAFNFLLFQTSVALPWLGTYIFFTVGLMLASWFGIIPYAPFFTEAPFVEGKIDVWYWSITLFFLIMTLVVMLFLIWFIVVRWRDRETKVEEMTTLLKKMFGRYLSTEVMTSLIENPLTLELGGERRKVTIMMTDLRGFTALSERLEPERVVQMLNAYFEVMVDLVIQYNGTINEIMGDALLVVFGAPQEMQDRAPRAVACAIAMQNAMAKVNEENRTRGLPELEMGIGLNEAEVIVGNIGSSKRSSYTVIGSGVNMASRIESYTIGGQVLISESVKREIGEILRIDDKKEVMPKGSETAIIVYEVGGIGGQYNLALEEKKPAMVTLMRQIPLQFSVLGGKHVSKKEHRGRVIRLSRKAAEIELKEPFEILANLKMNLENVTEELAARDFYGKIIAAVRENGQTQMVRFTSVPPEVDGYFQAHLQYTAKESNE